jgi:hypothetical protein
MDNILLARILISNKLADEAELKKVWKHIRPNKDIAAILVQLGMLKPQVYLQLVRFTYKQMGVKDFKIEAPSVLSAVEQFEMLKDEEQASEGVVLKPKHEIIEERKVAVNKKAALEKTVEVEKVVKVIPKEDVEISPSEIPISPGVVSTNMGMLNFTSKLAPVVDGIEKTQMGRFGGIN